MAYSLKERTAIVQSLYWFTTADNEQHLLENAFLVVEAFPKLGITPDNIDTLGQLSVDGVIDVIKSLTLSQRAEVKELWRKAILADGIVTPEEKRLYLDMCISCNIPL